MPAPPRLTCPACGNETPLLVAVEDRPTLDGNRGYRPDRGETEPPPIDWRCSDCHETAP